MAIDFSSDDFSLCIGECTSSLHQGFQVRMQACASGAAATVRAAVTFVFSDTVALTAWNRCPRNPISCWTSRAEFFALGLS
jgi:hypothetical protein